MTTGTPPRPTTGKGTTAGNRDALASLRIERASPQTRRRSGRKWFWIFLILVAVGGYFGYQYAANQGMLPESLVEQQSNWMPDIMQKRIEVRLESVKVQKGRSADALVVATGYLESRRQARIGARAAGRIDIADFEEGDPVEKGQVLAELEHRDMDASLAASKAAVARAKAALEEQRVTIKQSKQEKDRVEDLWRSRSISESEYDVARFAYDSAVARMNSMTAEVALAEAQFEQSEQLRENMFIRAPFDGTVISKDAEVGESILPGGMGGGSGRGSVATIADLDHLQIECDVQEDFISRVKEGQEAEIAVDAVKDKKYHGRVRKIIPMGDRARATIKVVVEIDDADELLFPEMAGTVFFLPSTEEAEVSDQPRYFCSTSAISSDVEGNQFVWIVDKEKKAISLAVTVGEERDGKTELLTGVTGKERVVVNPEELTDGTPVMVME